MGLGVVSVVGLFQLGGRDVAAVLIQASVVESVDPFRGGELDLINALPRRSGLDQLSLEQPVDRLRHSVVIARPDRSYRGSNLGFQKTL